MVWRAINEFLLPFRAWIAIKSKVKTNKFDLCINYAPTIFFGPLAHWFKRQDTYVYLVLRDMFPQWIIDQGLIKDKSAAAYFFRYFEKLNYNAADCIGVQSQANLDFFAEKFPEYNNVKILRNWASTSALSTQKHNRDFLADLGLSEKVIFFYGGNMGHGQDMENIMRLARNLVSATDAHFLMIGQGDSFNFIQSLKSEWGLDNVTILPSIPQAEFKSILPVIDIGLFSLAYNHTAHNFPGKLLGYMVESKPILGSVNPGNDLLTTIQNANAGFAIINGDDNSLMESALKLLDDSKLRHDMGKNARDLLLNEFSVESVATDILSELEGR